MTTPTTYRVTIRREPGRLVDQYVARDDQGNWRSRGSAAAAPATSGRPLAEYLFHKSEIATVEVAANGETVATITTE